METYGDTTLEQDFDFVLENEQLLLFEKNERLALHKGVTNAIWWVRFPLENKTNQVQNLLLEIGNQDINQLQLFIVRENEIERSMLTGDAFPFEQRPIHHRHFLFPFQIRPSEKVMCYLMSNKHSEAYVMPVELWKKQSFLESDNHSSYLNGIYLGLLLVYIFTPLLLLFFLRKRIILYYFLLAITLSFYILGTLGFGFQFFWTNASPDFNKVIRPSLAGIQFLFLLLLVIEFLREKTHFHQLLKILVLGKNIILTLLPIAILTAFFLMGTTYSEVVNGIILKFQFILIFGLFAIAMILMGLDFWKSRDIKMVGMGFVIFAHLYTFALSMLNNFGKLNTGPDFQNILLLNIGVEWIVVSSILFSEYWKLFHQKKELENDNLLQSLKIASTLLQSQENERQKIGEALEKNLQSFLSQTQEKLLVEQNRFTSNLHFQKIQELLNQSKEEIRRISNNIFPNSIANENIEHSVLNLCEEINKSNTLKVDCQFYNITHTFSGTKKIYLYRILQELLNNVVKHANATQTKITIKQIENELEIVVDDDGNGLGASAEEIIKNRFISIKNRTQSMDGKLIFSKSMMGGLQVKIQIPI